MASGLPTWPWTTGQTDGQTRLVLGLGSKTNQMGSSNLYTGPCRAGRGGRGCQTPEPQHLPYLLTHCLPQTSGQPL